MAGHISEQQFEADVVESLTSTGGYAAGINQNYDVAQGLDTAELLAFIGDTQGEQWSELIVRHGGDPDEAQTRFKNRLASELDRPGTLDVLRRGVEDQGLQFDLAFFRPASAKNPELVELYGRNQADSHPAASLLRPGRQQRRPLPVCQRPTGRHRRAQASPQRTERRPRHCPVPGRS